MAKDLTIYHLVKTQGERDPHAVAILAPNRPPLTYEALCLQVERTAEQLAATGITRHDRVAIVLPNGPEMATAFLGVASWATSAPLNPAYRDTEFDFFLRDLRAKALIVRADLDSPARQVARGRGIPVIDLVPQSGAAAGVFDLFGDARAGATARELAQPDDVALVLHTSGTTSRPKIVPLTHVNVCTSAHNIMTGLALTDRDRCLNVMPLFHIHGLVGATLSSLAAGASLVSTPGFQADQFLGWLEAFRPTWYTAVPTMHQAILARTRADGHIAAHSSLRFIRSCSAALAPQVLAELEERFKVAVIEAYGMTEASHQVTSNLLPPRPRKPGTVGVAAGPEVAIMDEAGILLPACQNGEVVIRGASVTSGYEGNPEANQRAFTNGWFRTGDHGTMDEDGYLSIVGRIKEMVNRGGEKIAPREVDEVLLEHPDVAEAVAFAVPHRTLGEDLAAAVVLRAKANRTERELRQFAFSRLADHKVPSRIVVVDQIPKGPTGKVQRIGLAEKLASRLRAEYVPPRNRLEEALAGIWAETLDLDKVGIEDNFFTLGGDSLAAVQASLAVETLTGKQLHRSIVFEAPTIGQLAQVLQDGAALAEHSVVLPLQPKGGKTPFFCVPGHGGNVFKFADLARCLGPDRPFYVFRFPRSAEESNQAADAMFEQLASQYVRELQTVQPHGPYLLGGFCFGGQVAFEMARRLHGQGELVGLVAIMELYVAGAVRRPLRRLNDYWSEFARHSPRQAAAYLLARLRGLCLRISCRCPPAIRLFAYWALRESMNGLVRYPGRITLFRCAEFDTNLYRDDPWMGWSGLAADIDVHVLPTDRSAAFQEPHVRILAEQLRRCLDDASP